MKPKFTLSATSQKRSANWYIVYTKPKCEKEVAKQLSKKKIITYCPENPATSDLNKRIKPVSTSLFSSYVFVNMDESEFSIVRKIDGVVNLVYWQNNPAIICSEEIEIIKDFISNHREVRVEKINVCPGEQASIICQPLMKREGDLLKVFSNEVKAMLPSFGYMLAGKPNKENDKQINYTGALAELIHN